MWHQPNLALSNLSGLAELSLISWCALIKGACWWGSTTFEWYMQKNPVLLHALILLWSSLWLHCSYVNLNVSPFIWILFKPDNSNLFYLILSYFAFITTCSSILLDTYQKIPVLPSLLFRIAMDIHVYSPSALTKSLYYSFTCYLLRFYLEHHLLLGFHCHWTLCIFLFPYLVRECLEHVGNVLGTCLKHIGNTFLIWQVGSKHWKVLRLALTIILTENPYICVYIRIFLGYRIAYIAIILTNYFQALQLSRLFEDHKLKYRQLLNLKLYS